MTPQRQCLAAVGGLVVLTTGGVAWSVRRAFDGVAISLSPVGFREAAPLSPAGEWFTIAFVVLGCAVAGFGVAGVTAFLVEGDLRSLLRGHRVDRQITQLRDHYSLCGGGAIGAEPRLGIGAQVGERLDLARKAS